jgi:hypothetical protein
MDMPARWQESVLRILTSVEESCKEIGLKLTLQAAEGYRTELESGRIKTYSDASEAVITLDKIVTLELRENLFMVVPADRAAFYAKPQLLGEAVNRRFSGCQYDIEESGNCYAAGRGTACGQKTRRGPSPLKKQTLSNQCLGVRCLQLAGR